MASGSHSNALNCEDDEQRLSRISGLLATLNQSHLHKKQPQDSVKPLLSVLASLLDPEKRGTHGTDTADLLERVKAFLPQLKAANEDVVRQARENPSAVDIETLDGNEEAYIEMNLGLGLFEAQQQRQEPSRNEDSSSGDETSSSTSSSSSTTSTDTSDDDCSDSSDDSQPLVSAPDLIALVTGTRPMRPFPKRKQRQQHRPHPGIVVLSSSGNTQEDGESSELHS